MEYRWKMEPLINITQCYPKLCMVEFRFRRLGNSVARNGGGCVVRQEKNQAYNDLRNGTVCNLRAFCFILEITLSRVEALN